MNREPRRGIQNCATEWPFASEKSYRDPFNQVTLDVVFTSPTGESRTVPAFWAGPSRAAVPAGSDRSRGDTWRVRYSSPEVGLHKFRTVCSDADNRDLNGQTGELEVAPYTGDNPLLKRGPVRVAANRRHLEHADGTPFFWLADTWWMGFCKRLQFPAEFQTLVDDRVRKGFNVIQIVAGLYPDMPSFDPRGANEAGFPWQPDWNEINPAYFDQADARIETLVQHGLMPCIVAAWGYFLPLIGVEKMKQHWRNLIARYGAQPVAWCLAGEGIMPYYLSKDKVADREKQKSGWTELAAYVRQTDPFQRMITIHPTDAARNQVTDPSLLDFDMLQTGHWDRGSIATTLQLVTEAYQREPHMPVINGEVNYEGIGEACRQEMQRFMFWICVLNGTKGHTYGANGIWQLNQRGQPYGPSPHGMSWGSTPWDEAAQLPGSRQVGLAKKFLERFEWWRFEPHPEWVEEEASGKGQEARAHGDQDFFRPYAAGIPGEVRLIFLPTPQTHRFTMPLVRALEPGQSYRAYLWNPVDATEVPCGDVTPDARGEWRASTWLPIFQDWMLVLERMFDGS